MKIPRFAAQEAGRAGREGQLEISKEDWLWTEEAREYFSVLYRLAGFVVMLLDYFLKNLSEEVILQ